MHIELNLHVNLESPIYRILNCIRILLQNIIHFFSSYESWLSLSKKRHIYLFLRLQLLLKLKIFDEETNSHGTIASYKALAATVM